MKKKYWIVSAVVVLVVLVGIVFAFRKPKDPLAGFVFAQVATGDLKEAVNATGNVKPASDVQLAFETGGHVAQVRVKVGDHVFSGTFLAALNAPDLSSDLQKTKATVVSAQAQLQQYQAALEMQRVKLAELKKGARPEDVAVTQAQLATAQSDLTQLYDSAATDVLEVAVIQANDAVNRLTDNLFDNDLTENPHTRFSSANSVALQESQTQRVTVRDTLKLFASDVQTLSADSASIESELTRAKKQLLIIQTFLERLTSAWDQVIGWADGTTLSSTTIATEKNNLVTAQTMIQTTLSSLTTRQQAIASQKLVVDRISKELILKQAPPTTEQIAAQVASVAQAQAMVAVQEATIQQSFAAVSEVDAQFSKRSIYAPFDGIITKQEAKLGETVGADQPLISMISDAGYQVEVNIPEVDIANLRVDQVAHVTLDAYPGVTFDAKVTSIDPAATMIEGVATYRTVFVFASHDERLRAGLTADVEVITREKTGVLTVPQRAVVSKEAKTTVRVEHNGALNEQEVVTGIRADGMIEIISGVKEGDRVVVQEKK